MASDFFPSSTRNTSPCIDSDVSCKQSTLVRNEIQFIRTNLSEACIDEDFGYGFLDGMEEGLKVSWIYPINLDREKKRLTNWVYNGTDFCKIFVKKNVQLVELKWELIYTQHFSALRKTYLWLISETP